MPETIINAPRGHTVNALPRPALIQLTPDRIVNVAEIREARRLDGQVMIDVGRDYQTGYREHFADSDGRLWKQLELAASQTIIISTPDLPLASKDEIANFLRG